MAKTTKQAAPPVAAKDEDEPVWGDMFAGVFDIGGLATASSAPPAREDKPAPAKPARKRPKA